MVFMPLEEIIAKLPNKYEAIILAAKEACRLNALPKELRDNPEKMVIRDALEKIVQGKIKYKKS